MRRASVLKIHVGLLKASGAAERAANRLWRMKSGSCRLGLALGLVSLAPNAAAQTFSIKRASDGAAVLSGELGAELKDPRRR